MANEYEEEVQVTFTKGELLIIKMAIEKERHELSNSYCAHGVHDDILDKLEKIKGIE